MIYTTPPEDPERFDAAYFAEARKKARAEARRQIADERARAKSRVLLFLSKILGGKSE